MATTKKYQRGGGIKIENLRLENLEMFFPWLVRDAVNIKHVGNDMLITMGDGIKFLYDDIEHSIRRLPDDYMEMSDRQIDHEFGERLRRMMERRHILQSDLAKQIGVTQGMISQYISGVCSPRFRTVDKIAKAIGCSVEDLRCTY